MKITYSPPDTISEPGLYKAKLKDVRDLGTIDTSFGKRAQILLIWSAFVGDEAVTVQKRYTPSMSPKSNLRKDLESWQGHRFTAKQLVDGVDPAEWIGKPCQLLLSNDVGNDGRTYTNVERVLSPERAGTKPSDSDTFGPDDELPF